MHHPFIDSSHSLIPILTPQQQQLKQNQRGFFSALGQQNPTSILHKHSLTSSCRMVGWTDRRTDRPTDQPINHNILNRQAESNDEPNEN